MWKFRSYASVWIKVFCLDGESELYWANCSKVLILLPHHWLYVYSQSDLKCIGLWHSHFGVHFKRTVFEALISSKSERSNANDNSFQLCRACDECKIALSWMQWMFFYSISFLCTLHASVTHTAAESVNTRFIFLYTAFATWSVLTLSTRRWHDAAASSAALSLPHWLFWLWVLPVRSLHILPATVMCPPGASVCSHIPKKCGH